MNIIDWRGSTIDNSWLASRIPAPHQSDSDLEENVRQLLHRVHTGGEQALREQAEQFDRVTGHSLVVDPATRTRALDQLDPVLRGAIEESIERVGKASQAFLRAPEVTTVAPGATITLRFVPVDRAGLYVPGGKAVYPSSVVMNVVAAQVAGVPSIALASPPQREFGGEVHPTILATAELLGVEEIYAIGGVGAIGALAYGVETLGLAPVSVITGPGNQYVATAKRLVRGVVGIDSEAGPTEIVVIADDTAPARWIAADLVSQAEHDELAQAILITTDADYAQRVVDEVVSQVATTEHSERVHQALTGHQSGVYLVDSLDDAVVLSNYLAPEHLEIAVWDSTALAERITHAGALFLGPHTPVSAGDYLAGSNHVLPTGRQARFQSGLSPLTFLRTQQVVAYQAAALAEIGPRVITFARSENLPAHADAVALRMADTGLGGS